MDLTPPFKDCELDPSFVVLDESDDEETIAEEESLEPEIDPQEELRILASDLDVSIEELTAQSASRRSRRSNKKVDYLAMFQEEQRKKNNLSVVKGRLKSLAELCSKLVEQMKDDEAGPSTDTTTASEGISELSKFYLIDSLCNNEDEDRDIDYKPMLKPKFASEIRMGPLYQAEVPEETVNDKTEVEQIQYNDRLLWKPPPIRTEDEIEAYLCRINSILQQENMPQSMCYHKQHKPRDNEKALEVLLQCNFNEDAALDHFQKNLQKWLNREKSEHEKNISGEHIESETKNIRENIEN